MAKAEKIQFIEKEEGLITSFSKEMAEKIKDLVDSLSDNEKKELAGILNISHTSLSNYSYFNMDKVKNISLNKISKIANYFVVSEAYLLDLTDNTEENFFILNGFPYDIDEYYDFLFPTDPDVINNIKTIPEPKVMTEITKEDLAKCSKAFIKGKRERQKFLLKEIIESDETKYTEKQRLILELTTAHAIPDSIHDLGEWFLTYSDEYDLLKKSYDFYHQLNLFDDSNFERVILRNSSKDNLIPYRKLLKTDQMLIEFDYEKALIHYLDIFDLCLLNKNYEFINLYMFDRIIETYNHLNSKRDLDKKIKKQIKVVKKLKYLSDNKLFTYSNKESIKRLLDTSLKNNRDCSPEIQLDSLYEIILKYTKL